MTISYVFGDKLYLNITNKCNCACIFCIRGGGDGVGDAENLWLEKEPTFEEIRDDLEKRDFSKYTQVVFCGYGEPTERLDVMLKTADWIKSAAPFIPVRLNTNGLCELSAQKPVAPLLKDRIDVISISLNAPDAELYAKVTNPVFGQAAFDAMVSFAKDCKKYVPDVQFTAVDVIDRNAIERCEKLAEELGIPLRVRGKI